MQRHLRSRCGLLHDMAQITISGLASHARKKMPHSHAHQANSSFKLQMLYYVVFCSLNSRRLRTQMGGDVGLERCTGTYWYSS